MKLSKPRRTDAVLFEVAFGKRTPGHRKRWSIDVAAWVIAVALHVALLFGANRVEPSFETWSAPHTPVLFHDDLASHVPITIEEQPTATPEPLEEPEVESKSASSEPVEPVAGVHRPSEPEPAPTDSSRSQADSQAQSASPAVVDANPDSDGPIEFTDTTFTAGTASAYLGASSRNTGQGAPASEPTRGLNTGHTNHSGRASRARAVQLAGNEWRCNWPRAAVNQEIYEQFVVLRVIVGADGTVEHARVMNDPGYGFGEAAVRCARRTRFTPAQNENGRRIRATSPPIRVRFTR